MSSTTRRFITHRNTPAERRLWVEQPSVDSPREFFVLLIVLVIDGSSTSKITIMSTRNHAYPKSNGVRIQTSIFRALLSHG